MYNCKFLLLHSCPKRSKRIIDWLMNAKIERHTTHLTMLDRYKYPPDTHLCLSVETVDRCFAESFVTFLDSLRKELSC